MGLHFSDFSLLWFCLLLSATTSTAGAQQSDIDLTKYLDQLCGEVERRVQDEDPRLADADCSCGIEGNIITVECANGVCLKKSDGEYESGNFAVETILDVDVEGVTDVNILIARLITAQALAQINTCITYEQDLSVLCFSTVGGQGESCTVSMDGEDCSLCSTEGGSFSFNCTNWNMTTFDFSDAAADMSFCSGSSSMSITVSLFFVLLLSSPILQAWPF